MNGFFIRSGFGLSFVFWLNAAYVLMCVAFGNIFFRIGFVGLTISEVVVFVSIIFVLFKNVYVYKKFFSKISVLAFFTLCFVYLFYSLADGRSIYFSTRQFAFVLYVLYLPAAGLILCSYSYYMKDSRNLAKSLMLLLFVSLIVSMFTRGGNIDGAVMGFVLFYALKFRSSLVVSILSGFFVVLLTDHAGHRLAFFLYFLIMILLSNRKFIIPFSVFMVILVIFFLPILLSTKELNDANALWRYYYWTDVISYLFDKSWLLFGDGFGIAYINPQLEHFWLLIDQIATDAGGKYQMMTTPTHNSFLNILYHTGLLGFISFSLFVFSLLVDSFFKSDGTSVAVVVACLIHMLSHNAIELPYMALPISMALGVVFINRLIGFTVIQRSTYAYPTST